MIDEEVDSLCKALQARSDWWAVQDMSKVTRKQFVEERFPGVPWYKVRELLEHNTFNVQKQNEIRRRIKAYPIGTDPRKMAEDIKISLSSVYKFYNQIHKMKPAAFAKQVLLWEIDRLNKENQELKDAIVSVQNP